MEWLCVKMEKNNVLLLITLYLVNKEDLAFHLLMGKKLGLLSWKKLGQRFMAAMKELLVEILNLLSEI